MSAGFTNKSVDMTSRKELLDFENLWVNFMVLCD